MENSAKWNTTDIEDTQEVTTEDMRGVKKSRILKLHSFSSNNTFLARVYFKSHSKNGTENTCKTFYSRARAVFPYRKSFLSWIFLKPFALNLYNQKWTKKNTAMPLVRIVNVKECSKFAILILLLCKNVQPRYLWNFSQKYVSSE